MVSAVPADGLPLKGAVIIDVGSINLRDLHMANLELVILPSGMFREYHSYDALAPLFRRASVIIEVSMRGISNHRCEHASRSKHGVWLPSLSKMFFRSSWSMIGGLDDTNDSDWCAHWWLWISNYLHLSCGMIKNIIFHVVTSTVSQLNRYWRKCMEQLLYHRENISCGYFSIPEVLLISVENGPRMVILFRLSTMR